MKRTKVLEVDFAKVEKEILTNTINHYNHMCNAVRIIIEDDPFISDYISSNYPIRLMLSDDPDVVIVKWAEATDDHGGGSYLEEKELVLDIKILNYSDAEIKSYLGARRKQYELDQKQAMEKRNEQREEREFEIYKNLKAKYEKKEGNYE